MRDCVVLMKYFSYLEKELKNPDHNITEYSGVRHLESMKTDVDLHQGPSFSAMSYLGPNSAIIRNVHDEATARALNPDEIYLLDQGAHYLDGTTDISRTVMLGGTPTEYQKEAYTRVLKAAIDLERVVWPANYGISGKHMDILARKNLWEGGFNYKYRTGHGIGHFLNAVEPPIGVHKSSLV